MAGNSGVKTEWEEKREGKKTRRESEDNSLENLREINWLARFVVRDKSLYIIQDAQRGIMNI